MDYFFLIPAVLYFPVIFGLKYLVDNLNSTVKKELNETLEPFNVTWDITLSIFSFMGSFNCIYFIYKNGYNCSFKDDFIWVELFCYSKVPELIDTLFIVLRGRKLVVLQYYHHLATLIMCWAGLKMFSKEIILGACINYTIHGFMYGYYALYSLGFKSIRDYGVIITFFQTLQMFVAMYNLIFVPIIPCRDSTIDIKYLYWYSIVIFLSYIYLFGNLFLDKFQTKPKHV